MVALPPFASVGGTGTHSRHPFAAFAQTSGCTPSPNQIIQDCTFITSAQFEQTAVLANLAQHGLPSTDAPLVYQYGGSNLRNAIRGYMMNILWADASADPSQLDDLQTGAIIWLQKKVQAEEVKYWAAAANEYNLWYKDKCNYPLDPRKARAVELRFFGGLSIEETADVMGFPSEPCVGIGPFPGFGSRAHAAE
jgi:hypothetical protein